MAHHTLDAIEINAGCRWIDEFDWSPIQSTKEYSVTGAMIVDAGTRLAGRPVTLQATESSGWNGMTRAVIKSLFALSETHAEHQLTLADGRILDVIFAPGAEPIEARPLVDRENPPDSWPYIIKLRLVTI